MLIAQVVDTKKKDEKGYPTEFTAVEILNQSGDMLQTKKIPKSDIKLIEKYTVGGSIKILTEQGTILNASIRKVHLPKRYRDASKSLDYYRGTVVVVVDVLTQNIRPYPLLQLLK